MSVRGRRRVVAWVVAFLVAVGWGAGPAAADVRLSVKHNAALAEGGTVVLVTVTVRCDPGMEVLEARISVSQDDQQVNGDGPILGVRCDGRPHKLVGRARAFEGAYHPGDAFASAFVLVIDPETQQTQSGGATRVVQVTG